MTFTFTSETFSGSIMPSAISIFLIIDCQSDFNLFQIFCGRSLDLTNQNGVMYFPSPKTIPLIHNSHDLLPFTPVGSTKFSGTIQYLPPYVHRLCPFLSPDAFPSFVPPYFLHIQTEQTWRCGIFEYKEL